MASMVIINRWRRAMKNLNNESIKSISTFPFLSQEPQIVEPPPPLPEYHPQEPQISESPPPQPQEQSQSTQNPASDIPLYGENWRNPNLKSQSSSLVSIGLRRPLHDNRVSAQSKIGLAELMNLFSTWMTEGRWSEMKDKFESWLRSVDASGQHNKPDVNLYNHYLRANLMLNADAVYLLDLISKMGDYGIRPNTASYNLVLETVIEAGDFAVAGELLDRMMDLGKQFKDCAPDGKSFALITNALLRKKQIDSALKYIDLTLKSGFELSPIAYENCVGYCTDTSKLGELTSLLERCKNMEQNKALVPNWNYCIRMVNAAVQSDNSKLAYLAMELMMRLIVKDEKARPPILRSVDELLVVAALGTAARTYNQSLLLGSWKVLKRSLREKKNPNPETYIARICAHASLGELLKAFSTLKEFEQVYTDVKNDEDILSPFSSLRPLVLAISKNGFAMLDDVYYQLENLNKASDPYKSIAALNCVIVGCANTWDVERAYQTFGAIDSVFGLSPNVHSYNGLILAFSKLRKRDEAVKIFEHFKSLGVKPNAMTYALLVDSHLIERDQKSALLTIEEMIREGFQPSKEMLKKVRRRSIREMDNESVDHVTEFEKKFDIRLGTENRRSMLFKLEFTVEDQTPYQN